MDTMGPQEPIVKAAAPQTMLNIPPAQERLSPPPELFATQPHVTPGHTEADPRGLRPTLFVGIGGLGGMIVRRLKRRLQGRLDSPIHRFLVIDTDRESLKRCQQGSGRSALSSDEVVHCPLFPSENYRDQSSDLVRWLQRRWLYNIPRSLQTEGLRPLGRLALVDHAASIQSAISRAIEKISSAEVRAQAVGSSGRNLRDDSPRIFVIASLTGGTGSGMVVDIAYLVRQLLRENHLSDDGVCGILLYASGPMPDQKTRARVNAYASLQELWHWCRPGSPSSASSFPGTPEKGLTNAPPGQPPFRDCYFLFQPEMDPAVPESASLDVVVDQLAEYLRFDATFGGCYLDPLRAQAQLPTQRMTARSSGLSSLRFPRQQLIHDTSEVLCGQLVERWRGDVLPHDRERIEKQTRDLVGQHGLTQDWLIDRLHTRLPDLFTKDIQTLYNQLADPRSSPDGTATPGSAAALKLLGRIDEQLGSGTLPESSTAATRDSVRSGLRIPGLSPLETAFQKEVSQLASASGQALTDWFQEIVETPSWRLQAAEIALNAAGQQLIDEIEKTRTQLLQLQAARAGRRLALQGQSGGKSSGLFPVRLRRLFQDSNEADRQMWNYFCLRLEEVLQESLLAVFTTVQARLHAWGQELTLSRRKLGEIAGIFATLRPSSAQTQQEGTATTNRAMIEVWPHGTSDHGSAVASVLASLPKDLLRQFDLRFQAEVLDAGGGLWAVLTGNVDASRVSLNQSPSSLAFWSLISRHETVGRELHDGLLKRARSLLEDHLKDMDLASLLVERYGEGEDLRRAICERIEAAQTLTPENEVGSWQQLTVVVPEGPDASELREIVLETLVDAPVTVFESGDAFLVCWETAHLSLPELAKQIADNTPAVVELAQKLQTRQDVNWSRF
jgi:hypothetical protein